jgi:hypothetical protein
VRKRERKRKRKMYQAEKVSLVIFEMEYFQRISHRQKYWEQRENTKENANAKCIKLKKCR